MPTLIPPSVSSPNSPTSRLLEAQVVFAEPDVGSKLRGVRRGDDLAEIEHDSLVGDAQRAALTCRQLLLSNHQFLLRFQPELDAVPGRFSCALPFPVGAD